MHDGGEVPIKRIIRVAGLLPTILLGGCSLTHFPLLDPNGPIGYSELRLIAIAFLIMLIPVIPVIVLTFWFSWRYRASRTESPAHGGWSERAIEIVVWVVPTAIVIALGILTWITTHQLDPYKPLASSAQPVRIEAIALDWKWLFIYPDAHIASVNQLVIPTGVPISFRLTSDTVMASFFIPRLGSQVYAMAGMQTRLHLLANQPGNFTGLNSQFSGRGFPEMHFKVTATSEAGYQRWLQQVRQSGSTLDMQRFNQLALPSTHNPVMHFASVQPEHLFADVIGKFMPAPAPATAQPGTMPGMEM
jgi:cytochrome o ubiquinol oxidase subunit 2